LSDYLSHLARASGIAVGKRAAVGPAATPGPPSRAATPPPADEPTTRDAGTPEPLHVEHITFVEQPRGTTRTSRESDDAAIEVARPAGEFMTETGAVREEGSPVRTSTREGRTRDDASPRPPGEATRSHIAPEMESSSTVRGVRPALDEERVRLIEPDGETVRTTRDARRPEQISSDVSGESPEDARAQPRTHASEETVLVAPRESSDALRAAQTHEGADAGAADAPDPAEFRRTYLREVVEWLSAPPPAQSGDDDAPAQEERAPRVEGVADEAHAVTAVEIVRERDAAPAARARDATERAREAAERAPEVEDFTLSIGSIQVVIEEPQGRVSAQPAPPPQPARAGRASDGGDDAVARLRRHYVRI
jgi:hypothetical protein